MIKKHLFHVNKKQHHVITFLLLFFQHFITILFLHAHAHKLIHINLKPTNLHFTQHKSLFSLHYYNTLLQLMNHHIFPLFTSCYHMSTSMNFFIFFIFPSTQTTINTQFFMHSHTPCKMPLTTTILMSL